MLFSKNLTNNLGYHIYSTLTIPFYVFDYVDKFYSQVFEHSQKKNSVEVSVFTLTDSLMTPSKFQKNIL